MFSICYLTYIFGLDFYRFSFKVDYNGDFINVRYPPEEKNDIVSIKKGVVDVLCGQYLIKEKINQVGIMHFKC